MNFYNEIAASENPCEKTSDPYFSKTIGANARDLSIGKRF